jgi:hypothetical protein
MIPLTPARLIECLVISGLAILLAFAVVIGIAIGQAMAHDHEHHEFDEWYASLKQPDAPGTSCCGESDAYFADSFEVTKDGDYVAIITDERPDVPLQRDHIEVGTKIVIPKYKIKFDQGNPTGHGILFVKKYEGSDEWMIYCYLPPGGV